MPSKGLMIAGAIGEGLREGLRSYQLARQMRMQEDEAEQNKLFREQDYGLKKEAAEADRLTKGLIKNDQGLLTLSPEMAEAKSAETALKKAQAEKLLSEAGYLKRKPIGSTKPQPYEKLPQDQQKVVDSLGVKTASKIAIANQIDSALESWDSLPDDQKLMQGRQLIKVLNSTEGADAVGTEEARRLGAKLEFAMGNLFNSNPVQFGRDLPGFKEQAALTSKAIRNAVKANEQEVERRFNQYGINRRGASGLRNEQASADPAMKEWADEHGIDYSEAERIIKERQAKRKAGGNRAR